jgi:predicted MFS family arabinose efflux permease
LAAGRASATLSGMALARRPLAALVVANALSLAGNVVVAVAVPWLVLTTTGSAALTAIAVFAGAGSAAAGGLVAGRIVDRIGAPRASALSDLLSGLAVLPLPLLLAAGGLELPHVIALVVAGTLVDAAGSTARQGMLPVVAARSGVSRERGNALFTSAEHLGYLLGAPAAGILIALVGPGGALLAAVVAFGASAALVAIAVRVPAMRRDDTSSDGPSLRQALAVVWADPALRALVVFPAASTLLIGALVPIILPVYAATVYRDPVILGILVASYGIGGLGGTVLYGMIGHRVRRRTGFLAIALTWPFLYGTMALQPPAVTTALVVGILGVLAGFIVPTMATIRQERSPAELLPRVIAVSTGLYPVVTPISVLVAGLLLDLAGPGGTLAILTAGTVILGIAEVSSAGIRAFDDGSGRGQDRSFGQGDRQPARAGDAVVEGAQGIGA